MQPHRADVGSHRCSRTLLLILVSMTAAVLSKRLSPLFLPTPRGPSARCMSGDRGPLPTLLWTITTQGQQQASAAAWEYKTAPDADVTYKSYVDLESQTQVQYACWIRG
eukprot:TRINITY_DN53855_c0_g2_i1.p2 TRINITY_DN53855_c0_g2~~TRINITY_DN53855_c0_g2_i1.p2  ORF type:complete len:109 (+),score=9.32 TRINITY_DN53855_c0_g2_i1:95-421(+)